MLSEFSHISTDPIECDLCIAGAGPAGLSIAASFIGSGLNVCLLEAGGRRRERDSQRMYAGENIGLPYFKLHKTRLRQFGGTANHWTGRCAPMDAIDFERRDWIPYSGWPFGLDEVEPYYPKAQKILNLGPDVYDERAWALLGVEGPPLDPARVRTGFWQFSAPVPHFTVSGQRDVVQAPNVRVLLHANVTNIQLNASATAVDHLDVASRDGKRTRVKARAYVLACGGIETPRLLMVSNTIEPAGVGNRHDLVGRFFMEHPKGRTGDITTSRPWVLLDAYRKHCPAGTVPFWASLRPSAEVQRAERILNTSVALFYDYEPGSAAAAIRGFYDDYKAGRRPQRVLARTAQVLTDVNVPFQALHRRFVRRLAPVVSPGQLYLLSRAEQAPNPDSRITLGDDRDALGLRRVRLNWQTSAIDKHSLVVLTRTVGAELERIGLGRISVDDWLLDGTNRWPDDVVGGHHHMGTTRMSEDPKSGVVDANARVHGTDNLYIAGSSIFPTGGWANPTLTIVALSLRLAAHLRQAMR
jgi:choline dehydrogenase-like flavoprotein